MAIERLRRSIAIITGVANPDLVLLYRWIWELEQESKIFASPPRVPETCIRFWAGSSCEPSILWHPGTASTRGCRQKAKFSSRRNRRTNSITQNSPIFSNLKFFCFLPSGKLRSTFCLKSDSEIFVVELLCFSQQSSIALYLIMIYRNSTKLPYSPRV